MAGFGGLESPSGQEGDVGDCLYSFSTPQLASWFCFQDHFTVAELIAHGMFFDSCYCDSRRQTHPLELSQRAYLCIPVVCMGWTWGALFRK